MSYDPQTLINDNSDILHTKQKPPGHHVSIYSTPRSPDLFLSSFSLGQLGLFLQAVQLLLSPQSLYSLRDTCTYANTHTHTHGHTHGHTHMVTHTHTHTWSHTYGHTHTHTHGHTHMVTHDYTHTWSQTHTHTHTHTHYLCIGGTVSIANPPLSRQN